jgi:ribonuclease-3
MRFTIPSGGGGSPPGGGESGRNDGDSKRRSEDTVIEPLGREHYHRIEAVLGYQFKDQSWLERALTHRSIQAKTLVRNDYERLEFLGDAVLDLAVAHLLLDSYPDAREGELSKMRAALVNTASLAEVARGLGLGPFIRLSRGELASGGAERASILADVFEALMGAIYREAGFGVALERAQFHFGERLKSVTPTDPKTELQEALHASGSEPPEYLLEVVEGPEHAPRFVSVVQVDGQIVGRGSGPTKKASQQAAAAEALSRIRGEDEIDQVFLTASVTDSSGVAVSGGTLTPSEPLPPADGAGENASPRDE